LSGCEGREMESGASQSRAKDLSYDRVVNFILWRVPWVFVAVGAVWSTPRGVLWSLALIWIGGACSANAVRCGRVHCTVMGPAFLILGLMAIAVTQGWLPLHWNYIWFAAGTVTLLAFLPEFFGKKYFRDHPAC
jgi:hypothetical protein